MTSTPLILIVGGDALAERVCAELTSTTGHRVGVLWPLDAERQAGFRASGATVTALPPDDDESQNVAGVTEAAAILTLSPDDGLNLAVALRARILNPKIRIVMRQFNTMLGAKIEQNLLDCTVLSMAAHSAATYAGAALEPGCFFAIRFPAADGPVVGFCDVSAADFELSGLTVGEAERRLRARIVALNDRHDPTVGATVADGDRITLFGEITEHPRATRGTRNAPASSRTTGRWRGLSWRGILSAYGRANPILRTLALAAVFFFSFSYLYFHFVLGKSWTAASFYVVETMTNVGFGETSVTERGPLITAGAIVAMLGGIIFTSIFIGYVSSALTRAQWIAMQGLRRVRARGHVVICGGGQIGSAVIDVLTLADKRMVVIEPEPDAGLVRRARERDLDLLTGNATGDDALTLCDIPNASAVLALTNSDTVNLEIALGARAICPDVPLVVRMESDAFARATRQLFGIATFSPSALAAPAFAGLSRFPGTRGRIKYAGDDHTVGQRQQGEKPERPPADECTPLCVWRSGQLVMIRDFDEMQPSDIVLFAVPLGQFRRPATHAKTAPVEVRA